MQTRKLAFLTALLLSAAMLWGCGSSGSGGSEVQPIDSADVQTVGIFNCSTCHAGGPQVAKWLESKHAAGSYGGTGGICLTCHDPDGDGVEALMAFGIDRQNVVGCESCHGGGSAHRGLGPLPFPEPGDAQCAQCHSALTVAASGTHLGNNPFSNMIAERFAESRKGDPGQRINNSESGCRACHSHQGAVAYLSVAEKISTYEDMVAAVGATGAITVKQRQLYPDGWAGDESAMKRCTTCHDAHSGAVRGLGDQTAVDLGLTEPGETATGPENRTVFSTEFNLCTACHQVNLNVEWVEDIGYGDGGMFVYTLADVYAQATADERGRSNELDLDYHAHRADGTPAFSRTMSTTHFAGELSAFFGDLAGVVNGYGVNPGSPNACTACHDPHSNNKFEGEMASAFAEGIGMTHGNYISDAFSRERTGCTPCHTGRELPKLTYSNNLAQGLERIGSPRWNVLGCVSCHDMAVGEEDDLTLAREFRAGYEFAFNSGEVVPVEELGRNQVCFECHKGRTPGVDVSSLPEGPTNHFNISYLHYSPIFATYYGDESGMVATYEGILEGVTYRGKSTTHSANPANDVGGGFTYGVEGGATCLDCHDVHTNSIRESNPNIRNGITCVTCHGEDWNQRAAKGNVTALADLLIDVVYDELMATVNAGFNANLTAFLDALHAELDEVVGKDMVKSRIKERTIAGGWPTRELAHAVTTWKVFYYEDRASWAHNRNFAYQMFRDAIESLGVEYQDPPGFNLGSFSSWTSLDRPEPIN